MTNKIIKYINKGKFDEIVEYIIDDKKLDNTEKLFLITLFKKAKKDLKVINEISKKCSLSKKESEIVLNKLVKNNYCKKEILKQNNSDTIATYLKLPDLNEKKENYNQKGSKIAKNWSDIFGTRQLTPVNLEKLTSFIDDGIEEDVIVEVMKISAENAKANPVNYAINILHNYLERNILSWEDFENERRSKEKYDRQVQKNNRAKEKRKELHDLEELKKRGWND